MRSLDYEQLFIGGRWQAPPPAQRIAVISPHTEEADRHTPQAARRTDVDKAVPAARGRHSTTVRGRG